MLNKPERNSLSPNSGETTSHSTKPASGQVAGDLPEGESDAGSLCEIQLDHAWIRAHIPHQGSMCLLDAVTEWDDVHIVCRASSHRTPENPLRVNGQLGAVCGIEYAAQAMAVHGALLASSDDPVARVGYLVSVRGTRLHVMRLDDITEDMIIDATSVTRSANNILYQFSLRAAGQILLTGRAAVVVNADLIGSGSPT